MAKGFFRRSFSKAVQRIESAIRKRKERKNTAKEMDFEANTEGFDEEEAEEIEEEDPDFWLNESKSVLENFGIEIKYFRNDFISVQFNGKDNQRLKKYLDSVYNKEIDDLTYRLKDILNGDDEYIIEIAGRIKDNYPQIIKLLQDTLGGSNSEHIEAAFSEVNQIIFM